MELGSILTLLLVPFLPLLCFFYSFHQMRTRWSGELPGLSGALSHSTRTDDVLPNGTFVKSGEGVTYFQFRMGRMEFLWGKDRLEFKPNRWFLEPHSKELELKKVCPYKFPVFQSGHRECMGKERDGDVSDAVCGGIDPESAHDQTWTSISQSSCLF